MVTVFLSALVVVTALPTVAPLPLCTVAVWVTLPSALQAVTDVSVSLSVPSMEIAAVFVRPFALVVMTVRLTADVPALFVMVSVVEPLVFTAVTSVAV